METFLEIWKDNQAIIIGWLLGSISIFIGFYREWRQRRRDYYNGQLDTIRQYTDRIITISATFYDIELQSKEEWNKHDYFLRDSFPQEISARAAANIIGNDQLTNSLNSVVFKFRDFFDCVSNQIKENLESQKEASKDLDSFLERVQNEAKIIKQLDNEEERAEWADRVESEINEQKELIKPKFPITEERREKFRDLHGDCIEVQQLIMEMWKT